MMSKNDIKVIDTLHALHISNNCFTQTTVTLSLSSPIIYECKNILIQIYSSSINVCNR